WRRSQTRREARAPRHPVSRHTAGVSVKITRKFAIAAGIAALALTVSACTTGDDGGGTTEPTEPADISAEAQAALDEAYEGFGLTLDDLESTEPEAGLNFYVMSCGESNATCAAP